MFCSCGNIYLFKLFLILILFLRVGFSRFRWKRCFRLWLGVCELRCCVGLVRVFYRGWFVFWIDLLFLRCFKGYFYIDVNMRKWNFRNVLWIMYKSNFFLVLRLKLNIIYFFFMNFMLNIIEKRIIWFFFWWYDVISIGKF